MYRKGYYFSEPSIGIELKLNKNRSRNRMQKELKAVLDDLEELKRTRPESSFYVLLLDKKKVFSEEEIRDVQNEYEEIRVFYTSIGSSSEKQVR